MTDFFTRQERSRRATRLLVGLFIVAVVATALAVTAAAALVLSAYGNHSLAFGGTVPLSSIVHEHLGALLVTAAGTLGVIAAASLYRLSKLSRGGGEVARMLGGREIAPDTTDLQERRLVNVVEEVAIASGLPVPSIFVLDQESAINAFAAGFSSADAAIAVTRGALERLERAELQGVIAHEFSHVLNGDMRLNSQLMGLVFGILALSLAGRWLLRTQRFMRRRGNAALLVFGIALVVIGAVGLVSSRLIKAAVSRQREALADASAVQFTRDPSGLAGALKKIGGYTGELRAVDSEEVAHMLFARGSGTFRGLFATHPPLIERIRALDPGFDPSDYPAPAAALPDNGPHDRAPIAGLAPAAPLERSRLLETTGHMEATSIGSVLLGALPEELRDAARSREGSFLLVLALALGAQQTSRDRRRLLLEQQLGAQRMQLCLRLRTRLDTLDERLCLPLLELALRAVRQRPAEQIEYLEQLAQRIVHLDGKPQLFDYLLLMLLRTYLRPTPPAKHSGRNPAPSSSRAMAELLAVVAAYGHADGASAQAAFEAGRRALGAAEPALPIPPFDPLSDARDATRLDAVLPVLARLRPQTKRRLLVALLATIRADGKIEPAEQELYRAIAATLGAPLPPNTSIDAGGAHSLR